MHNRPAACTHNTCTLNEHNYNILTLHMKQYNCTDMRQSIICQTWHKGQWTASSLQLSIATDSLQLELVYPITLCIGDGWDLLDGTKVNNYWMTLVYVFYLDTENIVRFYWRSLPWTTFFDVDNNLRSCLCIISIHHLFINVMTISFSFLSIWLVHFQHRYSFNSPLWCTGSDGLDFVSLLVFLL